MSAIAKLKLITSKRENNVNPLFMRRNKLVEKIDEQLALCTAVKEGRIYAPKRIKVITNTDGERVSVETTKRIKEWFWVSAANKINLSVRYGSKTLALNAKGANCIELNSREELINTFNLLKDAVKSGELDEAINTASIKLQAGFKK